MLRSATFLGERTFTSMRGNAPPHRGPTVQWTFYLESGISRYLPLTGPFDQLTFVEAQNFRFARNLNLVALRQEPVSMTAYRVESVDTSGVLPDPELAAAWSGEDRRRSFPLQIRTVSGPRSELDVATLARLVRDATGGEKLSAAEFAMRTGNWLRNNHAYSLDPRIPGGDGDPLVRWMASHEAGHCELFAGSFVLLARAAGFPARVVTGFKGGTWNAYSGNFTIRNSNAHAWTEIFDPAKGVWLRADPLETAAAAQMNSSPSAAALAQRTDRSWGARLESLRVFWYRRIVSFDQRSQAETLKAMKEATQNSGKRLRAAIERLGAGLRAWAAAPWNLSRILKLIAGGLVVIAAAWLWREFGRGWWRRRWRQGSTRHDDPVRREAGRLLAQWRGTDREVAGDAEVRAQLERLRFGARATWTEPEKIFRRARAALREARRRDRAQSRSA
jgi:transglutaminase-like putative cysteine protease